MLKRLGVAIGLVILAAVFGFGCGPVKSMTAINQAESLLKEARAQDADVKNASRYYYYYAKAYLDKAKTAHGYSRFDASERYALIAKKKAEEALTKAKEKPKVAEDLDDSERTDHKIEPKAKAKETAKEKKAAPEKAPAESAPSPTSEGAPQ